MPDPVADYLRTLNTSNRARAAAWDAVYSAKDDAQAQQMLQALPFSNEVRAQLWDARKGKPLAAVPTAQPSVDEAWSTIGAGGGGGSENYVPPTADQAVNALPTIGGMAGGVIGATTGPVGAVAGAGLGGGAGEAAKQLVNRVRGAQAPNTPLEAAGGIVKQGAIQGAAEATGQVVGQGAKAAGPWLMQKAVKPTQALLSEYRTTAPAVVKTLLDEGINVTQSGLDKLQRLFQSTNEDIAAAVQGATGQIEPMRVASRLSDTSKSAMNQVNPKADLQAISDVGHEFLNHPKFENTPTLSVADAQAMKVGTYKRIGKKYGELSSAHIEAEKALGRGLKEEIAAEVPQIATLNERDSQLMAAQDAVGRRVALSGNADPVGFAWVSAHPVTFLAALFDRNPAIKSYVARGLYTNAARLSGITPQLIRVAVQKAASAPDPATTDGSVP